MSSFATSWFLPPWLAYLIAVVAVAGIVVSDLSRARRRTKAGLSTGPVSLIIIKAVVIAVVAVAAIAYLATNRGVGVMFLVFIVFVAVMAFMLTRTRWGRWIYAVGGNEEAARRAGINVKAIYISALMVGAAGHLRDHVDPERTDAAEPRFLRAVDGHRRCAPARGDHRLAVAEVARATRAILTRTTAPATHG